MQRTFGIHRLWVITVAVVSVQQLRVMKKMHWFRSKWQKKKTRKIQYLLYTLNKNCNLKEFSEISGTQTDQLQAVPVSVGGGVMDRTVTLFVSERKGRSALKQKLQTSATQMRRDRCQMLVKPCVTTNIGEVVQQLKMQLGREKPQNLQMPLERPVQNYTPLARWNVQLILKTLGPGRIRLSGPNSNNLSSEIRRFWCDFFLSHLWDLFVLDSQPRLLFPFSLDSFKLWLQSNTTPARGEEKRLEIQGDTTERWKMSYKKNHPIYLSGELRVNVKSKDAEEQLLQRLQWGVTHQFSIFRTRNLGCSVPESNTPIIFCFVLEV